MLNQGYSYREQIQPRSLGQTVLEYLCQRYSHSTKQEWQARIAGGEVWLDDQPAQPQQTLKAGQILLWHRPPWLEPEVPLHYGLIYQDDWLLAVDKPSGLPTVPAGGFLEHTLLKRLQRDFPQVTPLHRLGRGTSGLVLFGLEASATQQIAKNWNQSVRKHYRALAAGLAASSSYSIRAPIGPVEHPKLGQIYAASPSGKPAHSEATVLELRANSTLFEVEIFSGRPHQIRIHLASIGHPLLGDPLYRIGGHARAEALPGEGGYFLHAQRLELLHPVSGKPLALEAPPPLELCLRS